MNDFRHKVICFLHPSILIKGQILPNVKCTLFMHGVLNVYSKVVHMFAWKKFQLKETENFGWVEQLWMGIYFLFLYQIKRIKMALGVPKDGAHFLLGHQDRMNNTLWAREGSQSLTIWSLEWSHLQFSLHNWCLHPIWRWHPKTDISTFGSPKEVSCNCHSNIVCLLEGEILHCCTNGVQ